MFTYRLSPVFMALWKNKSERHLFPQVLWLTEIILSQQCKDEVSLHFFVFGCLRCFGDVCLGLGFWQQKPILTKLNKELI